MQTQSEEVYGVEIRQSYIVRCYLAGISRQVDEIICENQCEVLKFPLGSRDVNVIPSIEY